MTVSKEEMAWKSLDFLNQHPAYEASGMNGVFEGDPYFVHPHDIKAMSGAMRGRIVSHRGLSSFCFWMHAFKKDGKEAIQSVHSDVGEVVYNMEPSFHVFTGRIRHRRAWMDYRKWNAYQGIYVKGRSFNDVVIETARKTAEVFGSFDSYSSFLTDEERENHKKEMPFLLVPTKDKKGPKGSKLMVDNPKHMRVEAGEINRRWLRWFVRTYWCQANWGGETCDGFRRLVESERMPELKPRTVSLEFLDTASNT